MSLKLGVLAAAAGAFVFVGCEQMKETKVQHEREELLKAEAKEKQAADEVRRQEAERMAKIQAEANRDIADQNRELADRRVQEQRDIDKVRQETREDLADQQRDVVEKHKDLRESERALLDERSKKEPAPQVHTLSGQPLVTGALVSFADTKLVIRDTSGIEHIVFTDALTKVRAANKNVDLKSCRTGTPLRAEMKSELSEPSKKAIVERLEVLSLASCDKAPARVN